MKQRVYIKQQGDQWQWLLNSAPDKIGSGALSSCRAYVEQHDAELWVLLPGDSVATRRLSFKLSEKRHLREALPFQLEEELAGDVDELHFSYQVLPGSEGDMGQLAAAWCDKTWLATVLSDLALAGLEPAVVIPEPLALPRNQGWTLATGELFQLHTDLGEGFAIDPDMAAGAMVLLLESGEAPAQIAVVGDLELAQAILPSPLNALVEQAEPDSWQAFANNKEPAEINLLQGEFSPRLPLARWWQSWRKVAMLAAAVGVAWLLTALLEYQQLGGQVAELNQAIESAYRSVNPQGALVDAERQLERQLKGSAVQRDRVGPVKLLSQLAPLLHADQDVQLRGFNYSELQGDFRLNCWAKDFAAIEKLRKNIAALGLQVELVHASADGEGQNARLRIRWRAS